MAAPVALILGAGSNVGAHSARAFASQGYKIALTSRQAHSEADQEGFFHIKGDLSQSDSVADIFSQVREKLGQPSVVIYNAAANTPNDPKDPLSVNINDLSRDLQLNTLSVLAAAHEATESFAQLSENASRTFIYTGNGLNIKPIAPLLSLGVGKSATAHIIASASQAYKDRGYRFFYADERQADGSVAGSAISGEAHAKFYTELASGASEAPWLATFVKGVGYKSFL